MGCYGIGLGRLMGTIVETLSDAKGIVWPKAVAPFSIHLISLWGQAPVSENPVTKAADALYEKLTKAGIAVLYDDRDARAGEKFADADLIGLPARVVISEKTLKEGKFEFTTRATGETKFVTEKELL